MKFPCEIIAEPFITQLRIQAARTLKEMDYTQTSIAELLQVTQPVVSGYLRKSQDLSHLPEPIVSKARKIGSQVAEILHLKGLEGTPEAIGLGCQTCKIMRQNGPTCIYHHQITSDLEDNCKRCLTGSSMIQLQLNKDKVLTDLKELYEIISSFRTIHRIIPEIGLQIVFSIEDPESLTDVAAFPGRIIKRKNRELLADFPMFGGSETTSNLLLMVRETNKNIRAICTLKTSIWLNRRLENLDIITFNTQGFDEDPQTKLSQLDIPSSQSFVIIDEGSIGYEAITYIFHKNLKTLQSDLNKLLT